jgi:hypothetical protein
VKASSTEREDQTVTSSTSSDSDTGTSGRKVPAVRDPTDNMKLSSKTVTSDGTLESFGYDKKGLFHLNTT